MIKRVAKPCSFLNGWSPPSPPWISSTMAIRKGNPIDRRPNKTWTHDKSWQWQYWLVVEPYPSEKWWSSSVGIITFPIYGKSKNACSKPPTRSLNQSINPLEELAAKSLVQLGRHWIEDQTRHEHMTNHDNNNVPYGSLWILPEKIHPSPKKTLRRWIHRDISCRICWASTLGAAARMMRPIKDR